MTEFYWVPTDRFVEDDEDGTPVVETEEGLVRGIRLDDPGHGARATRP